MAEKKRRVVVQGLGGAVPALQATIPGSVGQTRTQLQQATPWQESKLGQLSQALGVAVEGVGELKQIGEQQIDRQIEDLASKSPEEIEKLKKNKEGEFDKLTRNGGLTWLASPVNQERRAKAAGSLMSRDLISQITVRLENPEQGDSDADEIIQQLRDTYIEENPGIKDSLLAREGLQQSLNRITPSLKTNFDRKINARAKGENGVAVVNSFYDLIDHDVDNDTLKSGDIASGAYTEVFNKIWEDTNAHSPAEQRELFKSILFNLTNNGHADEARELRLWAEDNKLKFGTAVMSELDRDNYDKFIEDTEEQAESSFDKDQLKIVKELVGQIGNSIFDFKEKKTVSEFNGISVSNENELIDVVGKTYEFNGVKLSSDSISKLRKAVIYEVNTYKSPEKRAADASYNESRNEFAVLFNTKNEKNITTGISETLKSEYPDINIQDVIENNPNILFDVANDFNNQLQEEAQRLAAESEDFDSVKIKNKLTPFARKLYKTTQKNLREEYEKIAKVEKERNDLLQATKTEAGNEKVIEDSFWRKLGFNALTEKEKAENYIAVLGNTEIEDVKEQNKAYKKLGDLDFTDLLDKAYKRKPVSVQRFSTTGFDPLSDTEIYMTEEAAEEVKMLYKKSSIYLGYYTDLETLRDGLLPEGERFNPRALDAKVFPILTYKEIKMGLSTTESIKEKAELIGRGDDVDSFFNEQKKLLERYEKSKRTYPRFERSVSARPQNLINPFGF